MQRNVICNASCFGVLWGVFMKYKFSELHAKEVIHLADGERLGAISDIEIDFDTGKVISISVPGEYKMFGMLGREPERIIYDRE